MALTTTEAKNLLGSILNDWLRALAQGTNIESFLTWNTNAQRLLSLLTTEPAPVLVRQEFNEDNVEVDINTNGLTEAFMDSMSSFFDGPEFTRFLDTLRNQITLNYINPDELDLPNWRNTPVSDDTGIVSIDISVDGDEEGDMFEPAAPLNGNGDEVTEDVESPTSETVTEPTTQPTQTPVQVSELSDDDEEDEVDLGEVDDSTFEPHPDIDRNTRSRWTTVGSGDQMSGYVFAAYSHLPYHFTRGGHQYKLTLSGSDFVATRV